MMENFRLYTTLAWNDLGRNFLPRYFLARFFPLKLIQSVGYFVFWNLPYLLLKVKWLAPHRLYSWRILVSAADWTIFIFPLVLHWACVCVCLCGGGGGGRSWSLSFSLTLTSFQQTTETVQRLSRLFLNHRAFYWGYVTFQQRFWFSVFIRLDFMISWYRLLKAMARHKFTPIMENCVLQ